MKTDRAKSLVHLLKFGGLWIDFSDHRYGVFITAIQIIRFIYLILSTILMIYSIYLKGLKFLLSPSAVFIPLGFDVIVMGTIFLFKIKKMEKLILECDKNLSSYSEIWEQKRINVDTQKVKFLTDSFKYGMLFFLLTYILFFIIINVVRMIMGNPQYYSIPLPLDAYFDDTKERNANFYIFSFASILWLVISVPNAISFHSTAFNIISFSTTEINIVKEYLKMLYNGDDCGSDIVPDWELNHIIKKHSQILRINELQNQSIALPMIVHCRFTDTIGLCFVMFFCLQMYGNDTLLLVLSGIFIFILFLVSFVHGYAGNYLEVQSDELFYAVCNLPWYRQSVKSRKNYLFLVLQTSKTIIFNYGYLYSMNLNSFMQIVNAAFSYLMIMKQLQ